MTLTITDLTFTGGSSENAKDYDVFVTLETSTHTIVWHSLVMVKPRDDQSNCALLFPQMANNIQSTTYYLASLLNIVAKSSTVFDFAVSAGQERVVSIYGKTELRNIPLNADGSYPCATDIGTLRCRYIKGLNAA
jgi:hypothetical protein